MERIDKEHEIFRCTMINPRLTEDQVNELENVFDRINAIYKRTLDGKLYRNYHHESYIETFKGEEYTVITPHVLISWRVNGISYHEKEYSPEEWLNNFCDKFEDNVWIYSKEKYSKYDHEWIAQLYDDNGIIESKPIRASELRKIRDNSKSIRNAELGKNNKKCCTIS